MPLFKDLSDDNARIFIWKFDEAETLDAETLLEPENFAKVENYLPKKLAEILMVRKILHEKLPGYKIFYNADGQPFLQPNDFEISVSHSFPYAALAFSKDKIGIDLEAFKEKIIRVKDKFIQPEEQEFIPEDQKVEYLTVIWSIKESLYKLHHTKHWSLKKHYEVLPFSLKDMSEIRCRVHDDAISDWFSAKVTVFGGYVFAAVR